MINIILIYSKEEICEKVSSLINENSVSKNLKLKCCNFSKFQENELTAANLAIIDYTGLEIESPDALKTPLKILKQLNALILLIIKHGQVDALLNNQNYSIKPDDLIFYDRLDKEFNSRLKLLLTYINSLYSINSIVIDDLVLDPDRYTLAVNGKPVELTFKEYELLKILLENQDKVFSRIKLLSSVWGYDFYGGSRTVDVHMRRLRSKLETPYCDMLKTVRNVGYMFSSKI